MISVIKFPKDRENYVWKIIGFIFLASICFYALYFGPNGNSTVSKGIAAFFALVVFVVLYEKIYMLFTVDKVVLSNSDFKTFYKNKVKYKIPLNELGLKIGSDTNNTREISFYNLQKNIKIFAYKENDIDKVELDDFFLRLIEITNIDEDVFSQGTYNEILPLLGTNDINIQAEINYHQKKYFFEVSSYGWIIYPFVTLLMLLTLHYLE